MTHFDLITASGEIWRDVIANEMDELNIKEAWLIRRDEAIEIDRRLAAGGQMPIFFGKENNDGKR